MKKIKFLIIFFMIAVVAYLIFMDFYNYYHKSPFYDSISDIEENIVDFENSEASKYIEVQMDEPYILYNKTTEEQIVDNELCTIMYDFRLVNKTDKILKIDTKVFAAPQLSDVNIIMNRIMISERNKQLDVPINKGTNYGAAVLLLHTDKMTKEQEDLFNKYKNTVYFQVHINDDYYIFKYENKNPVSLN